MRYSLIILALVVIPSVFAIQGSMTLLAATEKGDDVVAGSPATLYLEIQEGRGRVFMETYPLTKIDTQVSARFAKEIACDYLDKDCNDHDFFYKIKSESSIIGGPSAGAAITILTVALLNDLEVNKNLSITGTINSGNIVGPVGGIEAKLEAAKKMNLTTVLIPKQYDENESINITAKADELNLSVIEVFYLDEALEHFTGFSNPKNDNMLIINEDYENVMKGLADDLCEKTSTLLPETLSTNRTRDLNESAHNLTLESMELYNLSNYYSAASRCYGANVKYRLIDLMENNYSDPVLDIEVKKLKNKIDEMKESLNGTELKTITDLQTYVIVRERLIEAEINLNFFYEDNYSLVHLANAFERIDSARTWSAFFELKGTEFDINKESLRASCMTKLREAEERFQYVNLLLPGRFENTRKSLDTTYDLAENGEYALCLFKAGKVKAEINVVLSSFGFSEDDVTSLIDLKLEAAKNIINSQIEKGLFPIVGYSYYEYSGNLRDIDSSASLLYSEYALELSRIDAYFEEKQEKAFSLSLNDKKLILMLILGLVLGFFSGYMITKKK